MQSHLTHKYSLTTKDNLQFFAKDFYRISPHYSQCLFPLLLKFSLLDLPNIISTKDFFINTKENYYIYQRIL